MSKALSAAGDAVNPPRMAIPPLLREMRRGAKQEERRGRTEIGNSACQNGYRHNSARDRGDGRGSGRAGNEKT